MRKAKLRRLRWRAGYAERKYMQARRHRSRVSWMCGASWDYCIALSARQDAWQDEWARASKAWEVAYGEG